MQEQDEQTKQTKQKNRVWAFSCRPSDVESLRALDKTEKYCKTNGIPFSYVVLEALKNYSSSLPNGHRQN